MKEKQLGGNINWWVQSSGISPDSYRIWFYGVWLDLSLLEGSRIIVFVNAIIVYSAGTQIY